MDAVQRCAEIFKSLYPNYREDVTTMCPRDFRFGYVAPISDEASGYNELKQIENNTIRGDQSEKLVFDALSKSSQPMFVIRGLKFISFLGTSADVESEIDFVIIHWKIGVLLLEVKSKDSENNYRKAIKQLKGHENIIKELLKILSQIQDSVGNQANSLVESQTQVQNRLEVYKVYAAPNDKISQNENAPCYLDSEALGDIENWFGSKFRRTEFDDSQHELLRNLCYVLVSQTPEVTTINQLQNCIDKQKFLQQSYDKQNEKKDRKKRKGEEEGEEKVVEESKKKKKSVVLTQEHPSLLILKDQFMFITEQQFAVWKGPRRQLIHGVTGSGKTILLQCKALECARRGEEVKVIVSRDLLSMYEDFFKDSKNVTIVDWDDLIKGSKPDMLNCHIFVDESQLILSRLEFVCSLLNRMEYYCWFALDEMQVDADDEEKESLGKGKYKGSKYVETLHTGISTIEKKGFHKAVLDTCMRNATEIHSFIQEYMKYSEITLDDGYPTMKIGHNVSGEKVKVFVFKTAVNFLPDHKRHFPSADIHFIEDCESENERHDRCMEIVKKTIADDSNYKPSVIFVVADSQSFITHVCQPLHVGTHLEDLRFTTSITALSHEWRTVFVICKSDEFLKNYVAMTRAKFKLVVMFV